MTMRPSFIAFLLLTLLVCTGCQQMCCMRDNVSDGAQCVAAGAKSGASSGPASVGATPRASGGPAGPGRLLFWEHAWRHRPRLEQVDAAQTSTLQAMSLLTRWREGS